MLGRPRRIGKRLAPMRLPPASAAIRRSHTHVCREEIGEWADGRHRPRTVFRRAAHPTVERQDRYSISPLIAVNGAHAADAENENEAGARVGAGHAI
jgi:hypothetical protein